MTKEAEIKTNDKGSYIEKADVLIPLEIVTNNNSTHWANCVPKISY